MEKEKQNMEESEVELDENLEKELEKHDKKVDNDEYKKLASQIQAEYKISTDYLSPKWSLWNERMLMYNNQMRSRDSVGDPLIFTILQTVLASLYDDRLMVKFNPRENGDTDQAENLTVMANYDYELMEKDIIDYDWDWDTLFYGKGLLLFNYFDRKGMYPIPQIIDPGTFLRDPRAYSINGDKLGQNRSRFCGWEVEMSKQEMKDSGLYDEDDIESIKGNDSQTIIDNNRQQREMAQGLTSTSQQLTGCNSSFKILKWYTYHEGKRVYVELANKNNLVLRYIPLDSVDIPIIERQLFRMPHNWDGTSIPDLIEDKQRASAVLMNLALNNAKSGLYKRYIYNKGLIVNKNDLNYAQDKHIGVNGSPSNVVMPVPHQSIDQEVSWIMDLVKTNAEKATASPAMQQGMIGQQNRTATELMQVTRGVDTRFSLAGKLFGWSEKRFWEQWYNLYKKHFKDGIDKKVVRLAGATANKWRELGRDNIIATIDPDVQIESDLTSEAKRLKKLQSITNFLNIAMGSPNVNQLKTLRKYGELSGLDSQEIELIIPPTVDELDAEEENDELNKNKIVQVDATDDHVIHIDIHAKALDTKAREAHIVAHQKAQLVKKIAPPMPPQPSESMNQQDTTATSQAIQPQQPIIRQN